MNKSVHSCVQVVWACIKISRDCQDNFTRNSARRKKKGLTKEALWENNISEWRRLKFCDALREAENKIKWMKRVAMSVAPQ